MKLRDIREHTMTHKEFDSLTRQVLQGLAAVTDFDSAVELAKDSPYLPDKTRVDDTINTTIDEIHPALSSKDHETLFTRIKKLLGF